MFTHVQAGADKEPGNLTLELETVPSPPRAAGPPPPLIAMAWDNLVCASSSMPGVGPLRRDAERLHAHARGRSFWLPRQRCGECAELTALEAFVRSILAFHEKHTLPQHRDPASGGAEFWVQVCGVAEGVPFHFDKDEEEAYEEEARATHVAAAEAKKGRKRMRGAEPAEKPCRHPQLATVTYLTAGGAPTVVFDDGPAQVPLAAGGLKTLGAAARRDRSCLALCLPPGVRELPSAREAPCVSRPPLARRPARPQHALAQRRFTQASDAPGERVAHARADRRQTAAARDRGSAAAGGRRTTLPRGLAQRSARGRSRKRQARVRAPPGRAAPSHVRGRRDGPGGTR
jgi:hypothetical protein